MKSITTAILVTVLSSASVLGLAGSCAAVESVKIDAALGEVEQPNEAELTHQIGEKILLSIQRDYQPGAAKRDAHPKHHGCVRADFKVDQDFFTTDPVTGKSKTKLTDEQKSHLSKGVLRPREDAYKAWIRFSNSDAKPDREDSKGDGRGMAIKLMEVEGDYLLDDPTQQGTQDFIMISHPVFIIDSLRDYLDLQDVVTTSNRIKKFFSPVLAPLALGLKGTLNAIATTRLKIESPLKTRYWSMVPYRLGDQSEATAIKFSVQPCGGRVPQTVPKNADKNYLRDNLRAELTNKTACMEFLVQPKAAGMNIEDSRKEWREEDAPFIKVATINIRSLGPNDAEADYALRSKDEFCQNAAFNPWHGIEDHRPLGAVNRSRKHIYKTISDIRRTMNETPKAEPTPTSSDW